MSEKLNTKFHLAVEFLNDPNSSSLNSPSNEQKLRFYGLYKQAIVGSCNIPKPPFYDVVARAKWDAWNELKDYSEVEAKEEYIDELVSYLKQFRDRPFVSDLILKLTQEGKPEESGEEFFDSVSYNGTTATPASKTTAPASNATAQLSKKSINKNNTNENKGNNNFAVELFNLQKDLNFISRRLEILEEIERRRKRSFPLFFLFIFFLFVLRNYFSRNFRISFLWKKFISK
jgi:acyl-CoA-binding protein/predicted nucleic acid-binding Zn ribbon protein